MQGIFQKENTDKALKYGIYRHLPTYEKIIRNLVSFCNENLYIDAYSHHLPHSIMLYGLSIHFIFDVLYTSLYFKKIK